MKNRLSWLVVCFLVLLSGALAWLLIFRNAPQMPANIDSTNGAKYYLLLPSTMEPASFNDVASLQYEDQERELYVMVIDESKDKIASFGLDYDLETYMKIALRTLDSTGLYTYSTRMLGDAKALQTELKSSWKGKRVVYQLTCIESNSYFYQVLTWTTDGWYDRNKTEIERIVKSFHENK
jgi:hypothetical protein